jgi:hypothetical protein
MTALNPLFAKVFRGPLDLNGPVLGRIFYLFEYARSYIEERTEAFDARFGTDTSAPVFERDQKTSVHFYVPTTASVIYEILSSFRCSRTSSRSWTWDQAKVELCLSRQSSHLRKSSA